MTCCCHGLILALDEHLGVGANARRRWGEIRTLRFLVSRAAPSTWIWFAGCPRGSEWAPWNPSSRRVVPYVTPLGAQPRNEPRVRCRRRPAPRTGGETPARGQRPTFQTTRKPRWA